MELQDEIEDYWTRRGNGFSRSINDEFENGNNTVREELLSKLGLSKGMKVLDIGCGPGYFELILKDMGLELYGIDYSNGMVENAKVNMEHHGIKADIRRMDAQALEFEDCMFDAVISRNVLWSLVRPRDAYSEILRVMKPGAKAVIIDGNYYLHLFDKRYERKAPPVMPKHKDFAGSHYKFNDEKVDFNEITELAKGLPLSKEIRPNWDFSVLSEMPCSNIDVSIRARADDSGFRRIGMFTITITKEVL
ncbi:MAG: methyltransferase domain-containing protein [archaeon]|nr:methyltransferase domain-containing protein [archaeon]